MDDKVIVALAGFGGAVLGCLASISGQIVKQYLEDRSKKRADIPRKRLLMTMLKSKSHEWRQLSTLMNVIGADEETTKRLLIEKGARASENGQAIWALIESKPLPTVP